MAYNKTEVVKRVRLADIDGWKDLTQAEKSQVKLEVGEYLVDQINRYLDQGKTPVSGGKFRQPKKTDGTMSKLFEEGDMRAAITHEDYRDGVDVGIYDDDQAIKAYGHNSGFRGHPEHKKMKKYERDFIPEKNQKFRREIVGQGLTMGKLKSFVKKALDAREQ